jgi:hypothetical protein
MLNKRLLIRNLLSHNDENTFYDKKLKLNLEGKEGKAKFLKHICALSNSNPENNSYIVIGVEDQKNEIVGTRFFDDARLQNLVDAYLENSPIIQYENVAFPHLPDNLVVGLVTISAQIKITRFRKNIWKYYGGMVFYRHGSISMPQDFEPPPIPENQLLVQQIQKESSNRISTLVNSVVHFANRANGKMASGHEVFLEQFVVCWSGKPVLNQEKTYYSTVDIELVNEQVKLFYSSLDLVRFERLPHSFKITEFIKLGLENQEQLHLLEEREIIFNPNGTYTIKNRVLFKPPFYDRVTLHHLYNHNRLLLDKLAKGIQLNDQQLKDLERLPAMMLICELNHIGEPLEKMQQYKEHLKPFKKIYKLYKEVYRIQRKIKYNS